MEHDGTLGFDASIPRRERSSQAIRSLVCEMK
jgi:hypothetical protein